MLGVHFQQQNNSWSVAVEDFGKLPFMEGKEIVLPQLNTSDDMRLLYNNKMQDYVNHS